MLVSIFLNIAIGKCYNILCTNLEYIIQIYSQLPCRFDDFLSEKKIFNFFLNYSFSHYFLLVYKIDICIFIIY